MSKLVRTLWLEMEEIKYSRVTHVMHPRSESDVEIKMKLHSSQVFQICFSIVSGESVLEVSCVARRTKFSFFTLERKYRIRNTSINSKYN